MVANSIDRSRLPIQQPVPMADTAMHAGDGAHCDPAPPLRPPAGAPNVLIVLIDDMGFGASSAFGGPCEMPHAERLADEGIRFTRFHTTALCSPTRQALLTGRNHHSANMGMIAEIATSTPGYTGVRPESCATLAQILRMNGYSTGAFGKMHQTPPWETSPSGPFDRWPTGDGFEKFYGFLGGDTHQYTPALIEGCSPIEPPRTAEEGYHLSEDLVDQVISWIGNLNALTPDKPWFTYLAFGATHAPHHAPKEYLDRYRGQFEHGYDHQRELTLARQKELGVIPQDAQLTGANSYIPAYADLTDDDRLVGNRLFEAYAAMATHTDDQMARLMDTLDEQGVLDNTLVIYILGDNGASAEAGFYGTFNEMAYQNNVLMTTADIMPHLDEVGGPKSFNHMPAGWAHAMNTPYQWSKIIASHWGGTRTGMIAWMPKRIPARQIRGQFTHVVDVVPTILELAGIPAPQQVNGTEQKPLEGCSFLYVIDEADAPEQHRTQYFEIAGSRGIYHDGWSAVTPHIVPWPDITYEVPRLTEDVWELYEPGDWTQSNNIAAQNPDKLRELQDRFLIEGSKYNVFPIDDRGRERYVPSIAGRPDLMAGRTTMTLRPGMTRLNENTVLNVKNRSFTVTATVTLGEEPTEGAVIAQGGSFGGWCLYFVAGVPAYAHNWVGMQIYTVRAERRLGVGDHSIKMRFDYDGGGIGKGGIATLSADGTEIGKGRIEKTVPALFSFDDALDVGMDNLEPVVPDYASPKGRFTGTIHNVVIDIDPDAHSDPGLVTRARYRKQ